MSVHVDGYNTSYSISDFETWKQSNNWTPEQARDWLSMQHPRRGDIQIELISPSGTTSVLLPYRDLDFVNAQGYEDWPFTSVQHWGEDPQGVWTLNVTYRSLSAHATVIGAELTLYGTDAVPQAVLNIPAQCDAACKRGCSGVGSNHCDACLVKRVTLTLECVEECPERTSLYKSHYCTGQDSGLPFSTTIMIISGSALAGVIFTVAMVILLSVCCIAKHKTKQANLSRYVRLQFEDISPTSVSV